MVRKKEAILPDMEKLYPKRLLLFSGGMGSGLKCTEKKEGHRSALFILLEFKELFERNTALDCKRCWITAILIYHCRVRASRQATLSQYRSTAISLKVNLRDCRDT